MLIYLLLIVMLFSAVAVLLVHEVGHFLVARWFGIRVLRLSVGIGPELIGFTDRYGTRWSCSLLPIGGYLKVDQTDLFNCAAQNSSALSRRAAVYAAGPVANVILFLVVYTLSWAIFGIARPLPPLDFDPPAFMLSLFGTLSLLVAMFSLMPIPPLDGGQLTLIAVEVVLGKPVREVTRNLLCRAGLVTIVAASTSALAYLVIPIIGLPK